MKKEIAIFWFRRDLRLHDNAGLFHALMNEKEVLPIFIFDKSILSKLEDQDDARVSFIHQAINELKVSLRAMGTDIYVVHSSPEEAFDSLLDQYKISRVYANHDYEPYAKERDEAIRRRLKASGAELLTFKDQVIFEKSEVVKDDGKPYTVFTPYSRKWKAALTEESTNSYENERYFSSFIQVSESLEMPSLKEMGFVKSSFEFPKNEVNEIIISKYKEQRDFPFKQGTTRLSVHLRFGTVSIRSLARKALSLNETWLNELIWREFYQMILWHFPHVVSSAFKPAYNHIQWRNNESDFENWCLGKTGYPIVDAGMRELLATGFMHNRVRMITASFLVKHLLIDWKWGEAFFARYLLDFELASNNGGWQWAASSGCDAAPYFRVFNPTLQTQRFDPRAEYIRKWVPEFNDPFAYPKPIVEHAFARQRVLDTYKKALGSTSE
jgi:deoxyribodipyrimidine photo-lyase